MKSNKVLGIEGGGTKTDWVLLEGEANQWRVDAQGQLPATNFRLVPIARLFDILSLLPNNVSHVGIFLAGCVTAEDKQILEQLAREIWPQATIAAGSDRESGFAAAFGQNDGIAVISGTGSAVTGRKNAKLEKAGGRGHLLGDRGGAYVICMEGLRLALRAYDLEHSVTLLAQRVLSALALNSMEDLIAWTQNADKMVVSQLAPVLFDVAERGDQKMLAIIQEGATSLAEYTHSVAQHLNFSNPDVKLSGGLFLYQPLYVQLFKQALSTLLPAAKVVVSTRSGALGAALLATGDVPMIAKTTATESNHTPDSTAEMPSTELPNPASVNLDRRSTEELVDLFIAEERCVEDALRLARSKLVAATDIVATVLQRGGRLFYVGAGTSGRLGILDASEIPPTFGESPDTVQGIIAGGYNALHRSVEGAEDNEQEGKLAILERGVTSADVVCGITASGRTPFVLAALKQARLAGAQTVLLTCNAKPADDPNENTVRVDLLTGPELLTGSTRLKAGTATKVALNILTTCAMIRKGKVKDNRMVDLNASNAKLRDRAVRIVCETTGISYEDAQELLQQTGWNVRKAIELWQEN